MSITKVGDDNAQEGLEVNGPIKVRNSSGTTVTVITGEGKLVESAGIEIADGDAFLDTNGNEALEFSVTASAVNHLGVVNSATGNNPILRAEGEADTGITLDNSEGEEIVVFDSVATSVNHLIIGSAATGNNATITAAGDDGNAGITIAGQYPGAASAAGGDVTLVGGQGGNTSGSGGPISITGGRGGTTTGVGGAVTVTGGDAAANNDNGGAVTISGGAADGSGDGGAATLRSGGADNGTGAGAGGSSGDVTVQSVAPGTAETGAAGSSGDVVISSANGGATSGVAGTGGDAGDVTITAGDGGADAEGSAGTGGAGGNVILAAGNGGSGNTPGAGGTIQFASASVFQHAIALNSSETIAAGGTSTALDLSKIMHHVDADAGGDIFTLANGTAVGQLIIVTMESATGVATVTPAAMAGGTSVTLNAAGDSVMFVWQDSQWYILGGNSYTVI